MPLFAKLRLPGTALPAFFALTILGCGGSGGVERFDLEGSVTYNGQPVPAGELRFEPNRSKGGSGPVGFTQIRDGQFDTASVGKGPVAGPIRVKITGYVSAEAFARELFPAFITEIDVDDNQDDLKFEVPLTDRSTRVQARRAPPGYKER